MPRLLQEKSEKESLAKLLDSQPSVDGETWQFQGDSGEWVSFPATSKIFRTFLLCPEHTVDG